MTRMRLAILILSGLCAGTQTGFAESYDPDRFAHNRVEPQPLAVQKSEREDAQEAVNEAVKEASEEATQGATQASLPKADANAAKTNSPKTKAASTNSASTTSTEPAPAKAAARPSPRNARGIAAPNEGLRALMERHARENGIPVNLVEAVARIESRFNPAARNGPYTGLMQIHPRTAAGIGYRGSREGLFDADTNLRYGVRYLAQAYRLAGGDTCGTIMRYQSGHGAKRINAANLAYCAKVRQHIASR